MKLHELKPAEGSVKKRKRVGRGVSSGTGRTSSRGHNGAKSRSGYKTKRNYEGGQTPLQMRLPKFGFKNPNRTSYQALNLDQLQSVAEDAGISEITVDLLIANKFISKGDKVKVLGRGELTEKVDVTVHAISKSAKEAIESQGGSVTLL